MQSPAALAATLAAAILPTLPLPLSVAALCAVAAVQQRSRALRTLAFASLAAAAGMPLLAGALPDPAGTAAAAAFLLSSALFRLGVTGIAGRCDRPGRALLVPAGWLLVAAPVGAAHLLPHPAVPRVELLCCLAADDVLTLSCLPFLLRVRRQSPSHRCLAAMAIVAPLASGPFAAAALWPALPFATAAARAMLPMQMARIVLWPGFAILAAMEAASTLERHLALYDELSGLLNRRGFFRAVSPMRDRALLLFDIDHFKRINDSFGHAAGDAAIRRFAHLLGGLLGRDAVLGRVGGEEFTAALRDAGRERALMLAEQVRSAFAETERALGTGITVSIGVALPCRSAQAIGDQMAAADRALYRAKRGGRDRIEVADEPARAGPPAGARAGRNGAGAPAQPIAARTPSIT